MRVENEDAKNSETHFLHFWLTFCQGQQADDEGKEEEEVRIIVLLSYCGTLLYPNFLFAMEGRQPASADEGKGKDKVAEVSYVLYCKTLPLIWLTVCQGEQATRHP